MNDKKKEPLFHIVKRDALPWYQSVGIRAIAIVLALIVCAVDHRRSLWLCQKDMDHISKYCDPSVDLAGTDSGF